MKAIKFTGLFLAAALLSFKVMAQQNEELRVPLSEPGKPYKLSVSLINGSITVSSYDGKDIIIEASTETSKRRGGNVNVNTNDDDRDRKSGMRRINTNNGLDITAKEKNNRVTIGTDMPMRSISLNIKIPQGVSNLKIETINNGTITVNNVNGDIEATNINGSMYLNDISGSVVASTVNGSVKVNLKNVDSKAPMAFSTLNGNVDVTFPGNLRANVKLKSDRGNVYTDFDIASDNQSKVNKTSKDGMYRLSVDETVYGKVNGGGPEVMMKTMNGSIYLRKAN